MTEEEIINYMKDMILYAELSTDIGFVDQSEQVKAVKGMLNIYEKQKRKNLKLKADRNKLINYIAIKENKDYEEVRKEFDIWQIKKKKQ